MAGLTDRLGGRVYLDTNVVVYIIEGFEPYARVLSELLHAMDTGGIQAVTSELTLAEALVKPLQSGRADIAAAYTQFVSTGRGREIVGVSRPILADAAKFRASSSLKLPDAIHVASAVAAGCTAFLTNDAAIHHAGPCPVVQLSSLIPVS